MTDLTQQTPKQPTYPSFEVFVLRTDIGWQRVEHERHLDELTATQISIALEAYGYEAEVRYQGKRW